MRAGVEDDEGDDDHEVEADSVEDVDPVEGEQRRPEAPPPAALKSAIARRAAPPAGIKTAVAGRSCQLAGYGRSMLLLDGNWYNQGGANSGRYQLW